MNVDTTNLKKRILKLKLAIQNNPYSIEESKAASGKLNSILGDAEIMKNLNKEYLEGLFEASELCGFIDEVARLEETLTLDLMHVETKYVITSDKTLISPAGFHPDERVFIQPTIAIHTNNRNQKPPRSNVQLYMHIINA